VAITSAFGLGLFPARIAILVPVAFGKVAARCAASSSTLAAVANAIRALGFLADLMRVQSKNPRLVVSVVRNGPSMVESRLAASL
jgi:hypothetical protein